jgi:hypothetical protein
LCGWAGEQRERDTETRISPPLRFTESRKWHPTCSELSLSRPPAPNQRGSISERAEHSPISALRTQHTTVTALPWSKPQAMSCTWTPCYVHLHAAALPLFSARRTYSPHHAGRRLPAGKRKVRLVFCVVGLGSREVQCGSRHTSRLLSLEKIASHMLGGVTQPPDTSKSASLDQRVSSLHSLISASARSI